MSAGESSTSHTAARPRVLVCDDSPTIRTVIDHLLGPDYECLPVASGEEALAAAPAFGPDLIVSDVLMEGMGGYELCRRIREDPALALVPVILLTSKADEESRAEGLELGADDYLFKPIRPRELLARVSSLLRLRRANLALAERSQELERANVTLREAQAALVQSEKLATVGTMVAGIAHEINNPLSFIKAGAAEVRSLAADVERAVGGQLADHPGALGALREALGEMRDISDEVSEGARRIQDIVASLRSVAAQEHERLEEVDLGKELERAFGLAAVKVPGPARLALAAERTPTVRTVPRLLGQVLGHVLVNALQASEGRGTVHASATRTAEGVRIAIRDEGPGIAPAHLHRIFDPFFTTKKPGQGVGLGLTVSYGIMRSLGGRIEAASRPGEGATFTLTLPLDPPELTGGAAYNELRSRPGSGPGGSRTA
jgi:signal transduction histidine kinase